MKTGVLGTLVLLGALAGLTGCPSRNNNDNQVAAVPGCGAGIPPQYCTGYNVNSYPYNPYTQSPGAYGGGYYGYGYGYQGLGYNYSNYPNASSYGCPPGYQPVYLGAYMSAGVSFGIGYGYGMGLPSSNFTCVSYNYFQNYYSGYNLYYQQSGYVWPGGSAGVGPAQYCDAYSSQSCGTVGNLRCIPGSSSRYGFCVQ